MENEMELFRAWLRKYVKEDRKITGVELAEKLGIKNSVRISHYHSGRVDDRQRTYPKIPYKIRNQIVKIVGIPYQQILSEGREILNPQPEPRSQPQSEIKKYAEMVKSQRARIAELKQQVADLREFKNRLLKENDELKEKLKGS